MKIDDCIKYIERMKSIHPYYDFSKFVYITSKTKGIVICPKHGEFVSIPNNLLAGGGKCMKCKNEKMRMDRAFTINHFLSLVEPKHPQYNFSKFIYVNTFTKGIVVCPQHGDFECCPHNLLSGQGCPNCKRSLGETFISNWLQSKNIPFIYQMRFDGCFYKRKLAFDFYIKNTNILIEYDGIQHFEPIERFGGNESLIETQNRDSIKTKWAHNNSYKLIRFNYKNTSNEIISSLEDNIKYIKFQ